MRSGTLYCNGTLYRKNMARFWPIWAAYAVMWVFILPLLFFTIAGQNREAAIIAKRLADHAMTPLYCLESGVLISAGFGLVAAMAVFSYLYFNRAAYMMHSLPMDRKTLFVTNYLSGLSFLLLPHLAIFLMTLGAECIYGCLNLPVLFTWLVVQSATALFFYSFAVFCAMFTGHLLALPVFYGILNILVWVILSLLDQVLRLLLYGFNGMRGVVETFSEWLTPIVKLIDSCGRLYVEKSDGGWGPTDQLQNPEVVAIYAVVGVVLTLCALWVYHKRHVESAGDVVAIPVVRPIFKYGVALCAGLCFGVWTTAILGLESELWLAVLSVFWAVVGYFVAEMLLRKSFRVLKAWKGAAVLAVVLSLLFVSTTLDWFGFEDRVPDPAQVTQVHIRSLPMGAPYDYASSGNVAIVTDPEQITLITDLHRGIVSEKRAQHETGDEYISLYVEYTLTDGSVMARQYYSIPINMGEELVEGTAAHAANALLNNRELVYDAYGFDEVPNEEGTRLTEVLLSGVWEKEYGKHHEYTITEADLDLDRLWQAVLQDFEEGNIGVRYLFDGSEEREHNTYTADMIFIWTVPVAAEEMDVNVEYAYSKVVSYSHDLSITLTPQAEHTLSCLEEIGYGRDMFYTQYEYRNRYD